MKTTVFFILVLTINSFGLASSVSNFVEQKSKFRFLVDPSVSTQAYFFIEPAESNGEHCKDVGFFGAANDKVFDKGSEGRFGDIVPGNFVEFDLELDSGNSTFLLFDVRHRSGYQPWPSDKIPACEFEFKFFDNNKEHIGNKKVILKAFRNKIMNPEFKFLSI